MFFFVSLSLARIGPELANAYRLVESSLIIYEKLSIHVATLKIHWFGRESFYRLEAFWNRPYPH